MRFMMLMIPLGYETAPPDVQLDPARVKAMMRYNEALQKAGINSTLWIFDGHAFLGYWRHNSEMGSVVDFEPADLINRTALGQIVLLETTAVTDSRPARALLDVLCDQRDLRSARRVLPL